MRPYLVRVLTAALAVTILAACSSTSGDALTCGPGTVEQDHRCLPEDEVADAGDAPVVGQSGYVGPPDGGWTKLSEDDPCPDPVSSVAFLNCDPKCGPTQECGSCNVQNVALPLVVRLPRDPAYCKYNNPDKAHYCGNSPADWWLSLRTASPNTHVAATMKPGGWVLASNGTPAGCDLTAQTICAEGTGSMTLMKIDGVETRARNVLITEANICAAH